LKALLSLLVILLVVSLHTAPAEEPLFELIDARLELLRAVAAYKWDSQLAIEDSAREKVVLDSARLSAVQAGIAPDSAEAFFISQIDAAKEIQRYWFGVWKQGATPESAPNLNTTIRPQLIALGNEITRGLGAIHNVSNERSVFNTAVSVEGLSQESKNALFQALLNIRPYTNRLQQILDTNTLRIGTTGDYAPFSYWPDDEPLPRGIDIELARSLSAALGVEPVFIRTSWPTLTQDLIAGEYDIAMSGVSLTEARRQLGNFSHPYHVG